MPREDEYSDQFQVEEPPSKYTNNLQNKQNNKKSPSNNSKKKASKDLYNAEQYDEYADDFENDQNNLSASFKKSKVKDSSNDKKIKKSGSANKINAFDSLKSSKLSKQKNKDTEKHYSTKNPHSNFSTINSKKNLLNLNKHKNKGSTYEDANKHASRVSRTASQYQRNPIENMSHRYSDQVTEKLQNFNVQTAKTEQIVKHNQQLRELLKRYNNYLNTIISKNLSVMAKHQQIAMVKHKKSSSSVNLMAKKDRVADQIKILREEIRNNTKMEMRSEQDLERVKESRNKIQDREKRIGDKDENEEKNKLQENIINLKKTIHDLKYKIQLQGKRLIPNDIPIPVPNVQNSAFKTNSSQIIRLKNQLVLLRKQSERNQQKIEALSSRQTQLQYKIGEISEKDKQAEQIITNEKATHLKHKKHEQIKKKHQAIKNHLTKMQNLNKTKASVATHQNQSLRGKLSSLELQIKQIEQSINSVYERSYDTINDKDTKNKVNGNMQRALEKIVQEMKIYEEYSTNKLKRQMTKSRLGKIDIKRIGGSMSNLSKIDQEDQKTQRQHQHDHVIEKQAQQQTQRKQQKKRQQQKQQRLWKQEQANIENNKLQAPQIIQEAEKTQNKKDQQQPKKPFSLNLKKNKKQTIQSNIKPNEEKDSSPKISVIRQKQLNNEEQKKEEVPKFVPRRIGRNLRSNNNNSQGYMSSINEQNKPKEDQAKKVAEESQNINVNAQQQGSKPMFKLKRRNKEPENQFMA